MFTPGPALTAVLGSETGRLQPELAQPRMLGGAAVLHHPAGVHHGHAVGDFHRCADVVGDAVPMGRSQPAVTRAVNELESHLGVRLLARTTRVVKLTEAGAQTVEDSRRILASLSEADEAATGLHGKPAGD